MIALSIVFLASEIARGDGAGRRLSERFPWVVCFSFGLLHGFGFAGALQEIGLPPGETPLALLAFNLGVEAGQLVFIAGVLAVAWCATRAGALRSRLGGPAPRIGTAYGIGSIAAF